MTIRISQNRVDMNGVQMRWSKGSDVISATALALGSDGNYFDITGVETITSIKSKTVGIIVKLHFDGILTLTHHSTDLVLPGGANITTASGDEAEFVEYATADWRCTSYTKADGTSVVSAGGVFTNDSDLNLFGGTNAGASLTSGQGLTNVFVGNEAGNDVTTGDSNVFIGNGAGDKVTTTSNNIAIGSSALDGATAPVNTIAIGLNAAGATTTLTGTDNIAIGQLAGNDLTDGTYNIFIGKNAAQNLKRGSDNIAIGQDALGSTTTSTAVDFNVAIGKSAMADGIVTGFGNVSLGYFTGAAITSSDNATLIGRAAGSTLTTGVNVTCLGFNAQPSAVGVDNEVTLGDSNITRLRIPGMGLDWGIGSVAYIPQNSQSVNYTLVLGDGGKHIYHPTGAGTDTFTIPANSSVAYAIGTAITFVNDSGSGALTIAITTDTMRLSPDGTTGSRTLAVDGIATAIKITSTKWMISGSGLT